MFALAAVRIAQGREHEAYQLHSQTLDQYRLTIGNTHVFTADAMTAVAKHQLRRGEFKAAESVHVSFSF